MAIPRIIRERCKREPLWPMTRYRRLLVFSEGHHRVELVLRGGHIEVEASDSRLTAGLARRYTSWVEAEHWTGAKMDKELRKRLEALLAKSATGPEKTEDACDMTWQASVPLLHAMLTITQVNGKPRETSSLLLFCEDGLFKACLNDRGNARTLWASGGTITALLEALEKALATGEAAWRKSRPYKQGKK